MKAGSRQFWMMLGYTSMGAWCIGAFAYIAAEMIEQHTIFAELRTIARGRVNQQEAADSLVERGSDGLLYVVQEIQQDPDKSPLFRVARALEKAGGRFRPHLGEYEKTAVRTVIDRARFKVTDCLDGLDVTFDPTETRLLKQAAAVFTRYRQEKEKMITECLERLQIKLDPAETGSVDSIVSLLEERRGKAQAEQFLRTMRKRCSEKALCCHLDESKIISVLSKVVTGEEAPSEAAAYMRANFEKAAERIDLRIAGEAFELYPEESGLLGEAAPYCMEKAFEEEGITHLRDAAAGLGKLANDPATELGENERAALKTILEKKKYARSLPAGKLKEWLAGEKQPMLDEDERNQLLEMSDGLLGEFEDAILERFEKEGAKTLELAAGGISKMVCEYTAFPTGGEESALEQLLESPDWDRRLPTGKLKEWLKTADDLEEWLQESNKKKRKKLQERIKFITFDERERKQLLAASDQFFRWYEETQERFAEVIATCIETLRETEGRFVLYEVYDDKQKRSQVGPFEIISALWKKIDDKVVMVDMTSLCGNRNENVRATMESALAAIGEPAIPTLVRTIRREKIDQALAAATKYRTKMERLRELNDTNKTVRLSCMRVLGEILKQEHVGRESVKTILEALRPFVDDKDPDIALAAAVALRRVQ